MPSPSAVVRSVKDWTNRHWPLLSALGYALAFAVTFGGVALAAYTSGLAGPVISLVCGAAIIWLLKLYVRGIRAMQRLIDRLHPPEPDQVASPDEVPGWAFHLYALLFVALMFCAGVQTNIYALVAWAAGQEVLAYFFARQNDPAAPSAFTTIDDALDRLAEPHWALLRAIGTALGFLALFAGVAVYAWQADVTRVAATACGPACSTAPGFEFMVAVACGATAILFVTLYTRLTLAAQRAFIDPFKFVRPEPKPEQAAKWVIVLHVVLGFVLLFVMTGIGQTQIPHVLKVSAEAPEGGGLLLGWWIGGGIVLRFFWARWRRSETFIRGAATPRRTSP